MRSGDVGHISLMIETFFGTLERCCEIKNRAAMLNGNDPAGRETTTIARAIDLVDYRRVAVAAAQEIGVQ